MLYRELNLFGFNIELNEDLKFNDKDKIEPWVLEGVSFLSQEGLLNGVGNNLLAPKNNTTREQAIAIVSRIARKFIICN